MKLINYTLTNKQITRKIYGIIGAIMTLIVPYIIMNIDKSIETSQSLCPHKMLTGLPCPGCGITKSLIFFYQGDILKSLSYHVLGSVVVILAIVLIILMVTEIITGREYFNKIFFSKKLAYALGIGLASYHFVRTIFFIANNSFLDILKESIWA